MVVCGDRWCSSCRCKGLLPWLQERLLCREAIGGFLHRTYSQLARRLRRGGGLKAECPWEHLLAKGAAEDHSGRWSCWHGWGWTSLHLDQVRVAEVGDAGFLEAAVAGHIL